MKTYLSIVGVLFTALLLSACANQKPACIDPANPAYFDECHKAGSAQNDRSDNPRSDSGNSDSAAADPQSQTFSSPDDFPDYADPQDGGSNGGGGDDTPPNDDPNDDPNGEEPSPGPGTDEPPVDDEEDDDEKHGCNGQGCAPDSGGGASETNEQSDQDGD